MKKSINLLTGVLLSTMFLISCFIESAKVVETEKQTNECVIGKWMSQDEDSEFNTLEFYNSGMEGSDNGAVTLTGGLEEASGVWQYKDIGEIEISTNADNLTLELLNCEKGVLDASTIYVKEE